MRKILLATEALAGTVLSLPGAQAATLIATIPGNDCAGVFGSGANCVTTGTFNNVTLVQTPLIAKFDFNENTGAITATTIGAQFVGIVTGAEFTFSGQTTGTLTYTYTPTGQDPLITYVAAKGGPNFNLFSTNLNTDTVFTPANGGGNRPAFSHISFYDTSVSPPVTVPEPMSLALFGAGLLGLGVARRARRQA
jgi:hypothetical protein